MADSMYGPFTIPHNNVFDGNGFIFYAAKTAELNGTHYLCGWLGRAGLTSDSGVYQWAGSMLNHQLVQYEDGTLGVREPETYAGYFTAEKQFKAVKKDGDVKIKDNSITLSAEEGKQAVADMGTRVPTMMLECDVTLDADGCAGFCFGGTEADPTTFYALCLDAEQGLLHYEGYKLEQISKFDPQAFTRFDFSEKETHHVKLVCENEIVVLYIDDLKALSLRVTLSTGGAHIGVFADGCNATFSNITMKTPG